MVLPCSDRISRVPSYSSAAQVSSPFAYRAITCLWPRLSRTASARFADLIRCHWAVPRFARRYFAESRLMFYSTGYLDVSVRRVRPVRLWIHRTVPPKRRVSPFGNPRISACSQLPEAYRSVLRPSSPLGAKAFTRCPCLLDPLRAVSNARMTRAPPRRAGPGRSARLCGEHAGPSSPQRRQNMVSNSNTPA